MKKLLIHPVVFVAAGFFLIIVMGCGRENLSLFLTSVMCGVAVWVSPSIFSKIIRRLKYVFFTVLILFAWQIPGVLLFPSFGGLSPSIDGIYASARPLAHIVGTGAVVSVLLRLLSREAWLNSLYALAWPLKVFGLSPARFSARLCLVLDYCEQKTLDWRSVLNEGAVDEGGVASDSWCICTVGMLDLLIVFVLALLTGCLVW